MWNGCDVDEEAIGWLRKRGISSAAKCNEVPPLPYPDECFDGVYAFSVLTHIHPKQHHSWYKEIFRVLKPQGLALLTTQGDAILASGRIADTEAIKRYRELGWCDVEQPGHYKNASLVNPKVTTDLAREYFDTVDYTPGGYQALMDQFIVRK
ncbi:MAG: class I SAM-dependent methyltransferase [Pyrinomonadaceae bacterium]